MPDWVDSSFRDDMCEMIQPIRSVRMNDLWENDTNNRQYLCEIMMMKWADHFQRCLTPENGEFWWFWGVVFYLTYLHNRYMKTTTSNLLLEVSQGVLGGKTQWKWLISKCFKSILQSIKSGSYKKTKVGNRERNLGVYFKVKCKV